jgi:putative transposase
MIGSKPAREHMKQDVTAYMRYYYQERLHSSNDDMLPVKFEVSQIKVCFLGWPEQMKTTKAQVKYC